MHKNRNTHCVNGHKCSMVTYHCYYVGSVRERFFSRLDVEMEKNPGVEGPFLYGSEIEPMLGPFLKKSPCRK